MQPRDGVTVKEAMTEIERIMRSRHGLKLDDPNDFNLETQDQFLKLWEQISRATFFALVVISSIALMVGGIGVMAIMSISVTERTREIGVRKALGARRAEILFQFLMEAAFLTSLGGVLGILLGSGSAGSCTSLSGFPISLPWWSFAIGLGLLGLRRHLFRDVSGVQGLATRSDRSPPIRVMAAAIWLAIVVLLVVAVGRTRGQRRRGGVGTAAAGAVYDLLNEDKRNAVEIIVEERAGARRIPEDKDGNLPDLEHPRPDRKPSSR